MFEKDRITEYFISKKLFCRRKISREGSHVGYRVYKRGSSHQFWDWFPNTGRLMMFYSTNRKEYWDNLGNLKSVDQVIHAIL